MVKTIYLCDTCKKAIPKNEVQRNAHDGWVHLVPMKIGNVHFANEVHELRVH